MTDLDAERATETQRTLRAEAEELLPLIHDRRAFVGRIITRELVATMRAVLDAEREYEREHGREVVARERASFGVDGFRGGS